MRRQLGIDTSDMFQLPPGEEHDDTSVEVSTLSPRPLSTIIEDVPLYIISPTTSTSETKSSEIIISLTNHTAGNEETAITTLVATTR